MIYTHFKPPFHHLSGVKQPLWQSDWGLHFPESSQVVLCRPAAAEAETVLLWATGLPHYPNKLFSLCIFPTSVLSENIMSLSRKNFSVLERALFILMNRKTETEKERGDHRRYLGTLSQEVIQIVGKYKSANSSLIFLIQSLKLGVDLFRKYP